MPYKAQPTNAGIITDKTGQRFIPESQRSDGSTRKAIKVRPGFRPTEDVELYRTRAAEARTRGQRTGVPGAEGLATENKPDSSSSAASLKNAKRREARKKAKAAAEGEGQDDTTINPDSAGANKPGDDNTPATSTAGGENREPTPTDAEEVERAKKARSLKKKLRQARELQNKKEGGEALLPEQIAKVIKINELVRELEALGLDPTDVGDSKESKTPGTEG
ncbi:hypothetical protein SODALDRAFT_343923 [Sodiomyces alkalinus F11]|uniref:WIBG Mago-binding domain-containing protein n=1 Tax=Sodiomyces alkalinus (strain CBS 110278 / VKM F-3762 / F11) TaxID=1314773 RepID=A0A3N2PZV3_SODAK|nr:hypothetical protein SODALDRAFT_343923 [Sodiomyces alkalinus F11]ROT40050.1 hypothetical protein SODALDRAFT_343923 [Sodiomyces alkalinus F11]